MKALRNISLTVVLLASLSACVENDPTYNVYPSDDVAFTYHITNEGYELDYRRRRLYDSSLAYQRH